MSAEDAGGPPALSRLRRPLLRFGIFVLIVAGAALLVTASPARAYLDREALAGLLAGLRQTWWSPLLLCGLYLVVSPSGIPVSPLMFAGGAVFGPLWGWVYNVLGCLGGALVSFALANALGKDLVEHLAGERRMRKIESVLERHGFWTLVGVRFLPVPFVLVNYGAALSGFRFGRFVVATLVGLLPSVFLWTYLSHVLVSAATEDRSTMIRNIFIAMGVLATGALLRPLGQRLLSRSRGGDG